MKATNLFRALFLSFVIAITYGCAGTYSNLVSGSNLGAAEYQPAVHVPPEAKNEYQKVLSICRQAAKNRQITSAQRAQLGTITGVTEGTLEGASSGLQMGNIFKQAGFDGASRTEGALAGAAGGLISSLGDAVSSGTESNAAETRRILLNCLRSQSDKVGYTVLE